jgi:hypothetical protein
MKDIKVIINNHEVGNLFFEKEKNQYGFNYTIDFKPISLIMPYKTSSYIWHYKLHPIFDMNMPEGYLFEIFKKYLTKEYGYIDDFLVFSHICSNIQSRLSYKSFVNQKEFLSLDIDEVLQNDSQDTFAKIVTTFLDKNAISGVQPKSLALLKDKESLSTKEYIIKTWGEEYPQLALNEYFCLKAIEKSFYKVVIMNYLLKNGDAHLKNFGILYNDDFSKIWFSPAYDVVNTVVYFHKDKPALTMQGKKLWLGKKELVKFGIQNCYLNESDANNIYENCLEVLKDSIEELEKYITTNKEFEEIGQKMIDSWKLSLSEKTQKEIPVEIIRNWTAN